MPVIDQGNDDMPDEFVKVVKDPQDEEFCRFPVDDQGFLPQKTVAAVYGRTSAMKFRIEGGWEVLRLRNGAFVAPQGGWGDTTYIIVKQS